MADENNQQTDTNTPAQTTEPASTTTDTTATDTQTQTQSNAEQKPAAQQQTVEDNKDLGSNKNPTEKSDAVQTPSTPEVVNEKTEFSIPEGMKIDEKRMSSFKNIAKELGLTKEQAQKLVDMDAESIRNSDKAFNDMKASWKADTMKMLGENAEQKLGEAAAAFKRFGDEEFVKLMQDTGLENHPAVVRVFRSIGSKISVDKTVSATSDGVNSSMTLSESLYGKN